MRFIFLIHPNTFTCSVHCEKNFPVHKARSDLDINIEKGCGDKNYLLSVENALLTAIQKSQPDIVLYDAGADVYEHDPLGLLNITIAGIQQQERIVLQTCLAKNIPVATVIGGGHDNDRLALSRRHAIAVEIAHELFPG